MNLLKLQLQILIQMFIGLTASVYPAVIIAVKTHL